MREWIKKLVLLTVIFTAIILFFIFDLDSYLTLETLKSGQSRIEQWYNAAPVTAGLIYFSAYVLIAALSVPGAAVMTLLGGALFGLVTGTVIVSFASSIGATLAFLVARYLLRDTVQTRYGRRLQTINRGIETEGVLYLFTLRLVPAFPFFVINLLMGLTPITTATFYWVSQLGMLPGTLVYIYAGTQLAQLESIGDILSPGLLTALTLLGLFPFMAKAFSGYIKRRRVYAKWRKPVRFDRNLIVIGAGAAGLVSAYIGAAVKAKVTLIEAHKMGGDCLNYGCVPSKALIKSARLAQQLKHADRYGLEATEPVFSFHKIMQRVHNIIAEVAPHDSIERYTGLGVEVLQGYARLLDPWTVEIQSADGRIQQLTTRSIIIAAGARPFVPPIEGLDTTGYLTSDTLWDEFAGRDDIPGRLVILGGGPIGCELAQAFARLGSKVTQIEMLPRIMIREDADISELAKVALEKDGVCVLTDHKAVRCEITGGRKLIVAEHQGKEQQIEFDDLICAVGRVARLKGYGLEDLGIPVDRTVVTNDYLETLYPNILAAGDVAGPYQFTHTAAHQAWYAAVNALFGNIRKFRADYSVIPWATFIDPEIARVGLNEQEAREQGIEYEVTRYGIDDLDRAIVDSNAAGLVKILTVPGKDRILGVTIAGEHAGDLLAEFVLAMRHGLGLNKILAAIHTYPTLSEANKYAAGNWKRNHAPQLILTWLQHYHTWLRG
jgi:pyruvate/2-oxoglutarate dehydrogenase complex dihydrolipoamide dehydrogenase (E3) component/uncharacterized membrane protein YdjX (TVP38/TMEM64 family)